MPGDSVQKEWEMLKEFFEDKNGTELKLVPLQGGMYWSDVADAKYEGKQMRNGDGVGMETWSALTTDMYCLGTDIGIPQLASGSSPTSIITSTAAAMWCPVILPNLSKLDFVGILGDDVIAVGDEVKEKEFPGVWEIDQFSTDNWITLGIVILDEYLATFGGFNKLTIDRGDKAIGGLEFDEWSDWIGGTSDTKAEEVYYNIMGKGTINDIPMLKVIREYDNFDFYERYRKDRPSMFGEVGLQTVDQRIEEELEGEEQTTPIS
jgi:hypothetical protein